MAEKGIRHHGVGDGGDLHLDLWIEILLFLPVETLIVLRAVCKSLLSIIDDPDFVSLHLRRFPNNLSQTLILTVHQDTKRRITTYHAVDSINNLSYPITSYELGRYQLLKASLDGLLLLVSLRSSDDDLPIAELFNPSINKRRPVPIPSPELTQFGLGYHRNDYKVVAACALRDEAWLYSVKTGSWTEISKPDLQYCEWGCKSHFSESLSFNDGVIWFESNYNRFHNRRLVWFDFVSERFRYTTGETFYESFKLEQLVVLDGGASVGVWGVDANEQASVWTLEADRATWTRRYEIGHQWTPYGCNIWGVEKDGVLVWRFLSWKHDRVTAFAYDIKTKMINRDERAIQLIGKCKGLYCESLVMLH